jgi:HNH endonuclease
MLTTIRSLLGLERIYGGKARLPLWPALRKRFLKWCPRCASCGRTENVVPHHKKPYHLFPELELEWDNLMPLCENKTLNCHLHIAHLGRWDWWNPQVETDVLMFHDLLRTLGTRRGKDG